MLSLITTKRLAAFTGGGQISHRRAAASTNSRGARAFRRDNGGPVWATATLKGITKPIVSIAGALGTSASTEFFELSFPKTR